MKNSVARPPRARLLFRLSVALLCVAPIALSAGSGGAKPRHHPGQTAPAGQPAAAEQKCGRLRAEGRTLVCADGSVFRWRGVTAFRLVDLVADGREPEAVRDRPFVKAWRIKKI